MPERRVAFSRPKSFPSGRGPAATDTVRDPPESERPRERLVEHGAQACLSGRQALSSAELLAALLGKGTKGEPVTLLARRLRRVW